MATRKDQILEIIKRYLSELEKQELRVEKVYLYGSYTRGTFEKWSDIDIAIISKDFEGIRFLDRDRVVPLRRDIDVRIEPMPYRPEDFNDSDPLAIEIMETGELIK